MKPVIAFSLFVGAIALSLSDFEESLTAEAAMGVALAVPIGAILTALLWPKDPGPIRGALIVALSYPSVWAACFFGAIAIHGTGGSLGLWVVSYALYAVMTFLLTGWLTIPAGAILGYWLSRQSAATDAKPTASPWAPSQTHAYTSGAPYPVSHP